MWKRRLTELFRKYGIRATFHLPSAYIGRNGYVTANETPSLYRDFEVSHAMINQMPLQQWVQEVWEDLLAWGHRRLPGSRAFLSLWRIHPTASAIAYPFGIRMPAPPKAQPFVLPDPETLYTWNATCRYTEHLLSSE